MNRKYIASELFQAAKEMTGTASKSIGEIVNRELALVARDMQAVPIGETMNYKVDPHRRTEDKVPDYASFAPVMSAKCRALAVEELKKEKGWSVNKSQLKREWSAYYTMKDERNNNHKFHYYAIFSFEWDDETYFVGMNCSGRIGRVERVYDLTLKNGRGYPAYPAASERDAKGCIEPHMKQKTSKSKGYVLTKMTRG
jgi:hypothetical protein